MLKTYIKTSILVSLTVLLFSSCSKELDIKPESAVSPEQINQGNLSFFLNGLYRMAIPGRDNYILNDLRGGNYTWTALSGSSSIYGALITGNSIDDQLSFSSSIWSSSYNNIYSANTIIDAADKLGAEGNISIIKAQASFLRALSYYQLVTTFGGVPLILKNTTENVPRNKSSEIWGQIKQDLDYSIANAKTIKDVGFKMASKEAAQALKARVLLATGDKIGAAQLAQTVIQLSGLSIDEDYGNIFRNTATSKEVLFAFANSKIETNLRMSSLFWPYGTTWAGSYFVQPSDEVVNNLFASTDKRRPVIISKIDNTDGTFNMIVSKYWDVQPLIIARISEMYLICAEGFPQEQGIIYLNDLRYKRGLPNFAIADFANTDAYLTAVFQERRRELYSEGFLFYDLVRIDKANALPNIKNKDQYLLPLPGAQIKLSKGILIQNNGY